MLFTVTVALSPFSCINVYLSSAFIAVLLTPSLDATLFKPTSLIALAITFLYSKLLASFGKSFKNSFCAILFVALSITNHLGCLLALINVYLYSAFASTSTVFVFSGFCSQAFVFLLNTHFIPALGAVVGFAGASACFSTFLFLLEFTEKSSSTKSVSAYALNISSSDTKPSISASSPQLTFLFFSV